MAGYLDDSFLGGSSMLPAKRPITAEVVYTPRRRRTPSAGRKPRGPRTYKATVETPTPTETPRPAPQPQADTSDAAFREKARVIGQWNEKRRAKERRLEESQFQKQLRREAALAKRKQRARKQSIRKHKRIARKMWRRLI